MLATPTITVEQGSKGPYNKLMIPRGKMSGIYPRNPPGFFSTVNGGDVTLNGMFPKKTTDGLGVIYSKRYSPIHPRSTSLQCTEGDSSCISFMRIIRVSVPFEKLGDGVCFEMSVIPLYHSHVLWCYAPRIMGVGGGKYSLSLCSVGPNLSVDEIDDFRGYKDDKDSKNSNPGLGAPLIANAAVLILNDKGDVIAAFHLEPSADDSLVVPKQFTLDELRALTYDGRQFTMSWGIIVPHSYFSLSSVIDLTVRPTVPDNIAATVATILRGEKPDGWDFTITGGIHGSGDAALVYYMHFAAMESKSPDAKKAATMFRAERAVRVSLDAEGLAAAVRIAYGVEVPLPKTVNRDMVITLGGVFADHFTSVVVPQWEREICRRALALDVRNPSSSSIVELLRLLDAIWEMPYSFLPVAKRVVIGVLADMMHLGPHTSTLDFVQNTVLPSYHESGMNPSNLLTVLASLAIHLNTIPGVVKTPMDIRDGVFRAANTTGTENNNEKTIDNEAEQTPSVPTTPSDPAHVELAMPPTELPYPEGLTDIDPASVPATRSCAIL